MNIKENFMYQVYVTTFYNNFSYRP